MILRYVNIDVLQFYCFTNHQGIMEREHSMNVSVRTRLIQGAGRRLDDTMVRSPNFMDGVRFRLKLPILVLAAALYAASKGGVYVRKIGIANS